MKPLLTLLLFITPLVLITAQDLAQSNTPKIITKLNVGNSISFSSKSIKFIKVIEDSRCPTDINCIWPGEVKISIALYEKDVLLEEQELIFGPQNINPDHIVEILNIEQKRIYGYNISPYPSANDAINPSDYQLELLIN
ncbi:MULTISPECIES: hypothetical protein [Aquimarina]|uniref:Uncharacterized protein n=1 Tax=Aquimarina algiphila TaxID=2047982 RepID=A0A554VHJ5_9FLAO|nr:MULTISPECIES: hypothetical protein [Aquimarina]TSE06986.1 hypothetical protein FOF46_17340 [Aquimarina algiphila]